jgi:hypothetical protein
LRLRGTAIAAWLALPAPAHAIPAFARRYEQSCTTCHQFHFPRLNAVGRRFADRGSRLADGAEDPARARRTIEPGTIAEDLAVFKETPLGVRGQVLGVAPVDAEAQGEPVWDTRVFSYLYGGGSVAKTVSLFFSWTPFPEPTLHQAKIGLHDLLAGWLGAGALHLRAGALLLLDSSNAAHRHLVSAPNRIGAVAVGLNRFVLDDTQLGATIYGRPAKGPLRYEIAVVAGDPGPEPGAGDKDDWKDLWARVACTWFRNTDHEFVLGAFGYLGRSDIETDVGGVTLAQRDDFWIAGGDAEADIGPLTLLGAGYARRHADALAGGGAVALQGWRAEALWGVDRRVTASLRFEQVRSDDAPDLDERWLTPHVSYLVATNVVAAIVGRLDVDDAGRGSVVVDLDVAF